MNERFIATHFKNISVCIARAQLFGSRIGTSFYLFSVSMGWIMFAKQLKKKNSVHGEESK